MSNAAELKRAERKTDLVRTAISTLGMASTAQVEGHLLVMGYDLRSLNVSGLLTYLSTRHEVSYVREKRMWRWEGL